MKRDAKWKVFEPFFMLSSAYLKSTARCPPGNPFVVFAVRIDYNPPTLSILSDFLQEGFIS